MAFGYWQVHLFNSPPAISCLFALLIPPPPFHPSYLQLPSLLPHSLITHSSQPNQHKKKSMDFESTSSSFSSYYHIIFITLALAISSLIFFFSQTKKKKPHLRLPPGPPGWPVVGNLFQVANSGKDFFAYIRDDMLPKYGPIFTLKMGSRTMVIISSAELVHEALIEKSQAFASRPAENATRAVFSCDKFTVNAAVYGPVWRALRKNMVQNGLSAMRLKEFKNVREDAMDKFVEKIKSEAKESGNGTVLVLKNARFAVFSILLSMCFGVEMSEETIEKIDHILKLVLITLQVPRIDDFLPILRPFFAKHWKKAMQIRQQQIETLVPFIEERRSILRSGLKSNPKAAPFSYLDTLFDLHIEGRTESNGRSGPTDAEIVTLCSEFINGGTDTTATAIEWAVARLIENPSIQARLYEEIRAVVGPDQPVNEKDIDNLPYLRAFVKELLRKHPPTYFSLTHAAIEPAALLGGYHVPTDCNLEIFLPSISEDPKLWVDPHKFDPDRFMSGREDTDMTGVKGIKMIPFGVGRRICPGLNMATIHVHLMVARLVQEFEWSAYPEGSKIDFSEKLEFTVVMRNPLRAKITPRS